MFRSVSKSVFQSGWDTELKVAWEHHAALECKSFMQLSDAEHVTVYENHVALECDTFHHRGLNGGGWYRLDMKLDRH